MLGNGVMQDEEPNCLDEDFGRGARQAIFTDVGH